jgi:hypothetical protein
MMKPFDELYAGMEKALAGLDGTGPGRYAAGLAVIAESVTRMHAAAAKIHTGAQDSSTGYLMSSILAI